VRRLLWPFRQRRQRAAALVSAFHPSSRRGMSEERKRLIWPAFAATSGRDGCAGIRRVQTCSVLWAAVESLIHALFEGRSKKQGEFVRPGATSVSTISGPASMVTDIPIPGQIARVRQRLYLVERATPGPSAGDATLVGLSCVDDDAQGQPLEVLWERE